MSHSSIHHPVPGTGAHHESEHHRFLAHHFGSLQQQFDAGKFGMWLFLVTEVLFFSGLFCAYAVYRSTHPEAFANADKYLDSTLGATNTAVLIFSSLTMAWAVRASQLGQQKLLVRLLAITLMCASIFLGVKAVEYSHKWDLGILWASRFHPADHVAHSSALLVLSLPAVVAMVVTALGFLIAKSRKAAVATPFWMWMFVVSAAFFLGVGIGKGVPVIEESLTGKSHGAVAVSHEQTSGEHKTDTAHAAQAAHPEPESHAKADVPAPAASPAASTAAPAPAAAAPAPTGTATSAAEQEMVYTGIFFSIYYMMTGLHAIHILAGMGTIAWLLWRSLRGDFGPDYFGPVDYVGLYWHLVDLIWIYLFPLLYLIG